MLNDRYEHVLDQKSEGAHYTPRNLADFVTGEILKHVSVKKEMYVVDPALGDGELLLSLIEKLKHQKINVHAFGFDTNKNSIEIASDRIRSEFPDVPQSLIYGDFLDFCTKQKTLFGESEFPSFDILIANPPYVRTQVLGTEMSRRLRADFGLSGRVDIYQAFLVAMKQVLTPSSVSGVIVSNRFLTTKGARRFRELLYRNYAIHEIWDFGDTKLFDAAVLPAVMVMSPTNGTPVEKTPFTSVYETREITDVFGNKLPDPIEAIRLSETNRSGEITGFRVRKGHLSFEKKPSNVWRLTTNESELWLSDVAKNTKMLFRDIGKVRVGVKTTADQVFIRKDWKHEVGYEPELLQPLITHHVASRFRRKDKPLKAILYPHKSNGGKREVIDLRDFPLSERYLLSHYQKLSSRSYLTKANRKWYEIWVPQDPELWCEHKVIFRDISIKPTFWMDLDCSVVNGDCYWLIKEDESLPLDILWLVLAVANSTFIEEYYDLNFNNKLYSQRRRFITQYVENFPIPDPQTSLAEEVTSLSKKIYSENDPLAFVEIESRIDRLVWKMFSVTPIL